MTYDARVPMVADSELSFSFRLSFRAGICAPERNEAPCRRGEMRHRHGRFLEDKDKYLTKFIQSGFACAPCHSPQTSSQQLFVSFLQRARTAFETWSQV